MSAKDRLMQYLDFKEIKKATFYKITGLSNGFLDKNDNINSDKLETIISNFNDIDLYWLILGEGEMIKENTKSELTNNDSQQINRLLGIIESQQRQAESQQRVIENLSKKTVAHRDEPASSATAV